MDYFFELNSRLHLTGQSGENPDYIENYIIHDKLTATPSHIDSPPPGISQIGTQPYSH